MSELRVVGRDDNRALCIVTTDHIREFDLLVPATLMPFVLFTALDARAISDADLYAFAHRMLRAGCAYACAWGPGSGRVERELDEAFIDLQLAGGRSAAAGPGGEDLVVTTSDEAESIDDELWFAVYCAYPAWVAARSVIAVCDPEFAAAIETRLADSARWNDEVLRRDEEGD